MDDLHARGRARGICSRMPRSANLVGRHPGGFAGTLVGRLGWLVGRLVGRLVGCLVGCLIGCLVGRLVGPPRRVPRPLEPPSSMLAQQMGSAMVPPRRRAENCMDWTPPTETPSNPPPHSCCDAPSSAGLLNANTKEGGRGGVRAIARRMRCAVPATVTIDR